VRTATDLASVALLFKDDTNPTRRLAALQHLLGDARYREMVVREVVERRDGRLAREIGLSAARTLAATDAIAVLERVCHLAPQQLTGAFLHLGAGDSSALRQAYEQRLADGTASAFRAELITGAGFTGRAEDIALAQLAFRQDPHPDVRSRAMLVLTAQAGTALGEQTLMAALDDATFSADPARLGQIVLALENLAPGGDPNAIDRVAKRLLVRSELLPGDRSNLEKVLARALPRQR
jgi:hypothetical protein